MPKDTTPAPSQLNNAVIPLKRRRQRTTTGCQDCRKRRVKCPEGPITADGRKMTCQKCFEGDVECLYPHKEGKETVWRGAAPFEAALPACKPEEHLSPFTSSPWSPAVPTWRGNQDGERSTSTKIVPIAPVELRLEITPEKFGESSKRRLDDVLEPEHDDIITLPRRPPPETRRNEKNIRRYTINPQSPLASFTLSSLSQKDLDRSVIHSFEIQGFSQIIAASQSRINWLHSLLFPRLYDALSYDSPTSDMMQQNIRKLLFHNFLQLSFVHDANMTSNAGRMIHCKVEAMAHREQAKLAETRLRVGFPKKAWQSEEFLTGFFVGCMADMLNSQRFDVSDETLSVLSESDYGSSLREMLGVYSMFMSMSRPHDPLMSYKITDSTFRLNPQGSHWVENFFGISRGVLGMFPKVNRLVQQRSELLHIEMTPEEEKTAYQDLRIKANEVMAELSVHRDWSEVSLLAHAPHRVQRGSEVTRRALITLILCEVFNVPLTDPRLHANRIVAGELVADTSADQTAGYLWPLSVIAIYTRQVDHRLCLRDKVVNASDWAHGPGLVGFGPVLDACWRMLDEEGSYPHGIAPWREVLFASGRTVCI